MMRRHRITITALFLIFMILVLDIDAYAGYTGEISENDIYENTVYEDTDTSYYVSTIEISQLSDLQEMVANCSYDQYSYNKKFVLMNDITVTDGYFEGIPYFDGYFDGNGYTITVNGMKTPGTAYGLFRYIGSHGCVENLNVEANITTGGSKSEIGGICGVNYGSIKSCTFSGKISGDDTIAGICGKNGFSGVIMGCTNNGQIAARNKAGGICGYNEGSIVGCSNNGKINAEEMTNSFDSNGVVDISSFNITQTVITRNDTGGICGLSTGLVSSCVNSADIGYLHTGYNTGGIVGRQSGIVMLCINEGKIYGRKDVGGIVGQNEPYIESEKLSDEIDQTREDINALNDTLSAMTATASNTTDRVGEYADNLYEQYIEDKENVASELDGIANDIREDDIETSEYTERIEQARRRIDELEAQAQDLREHPEKLHDAQYTGPTYEEVLDEIQANYNTINENVAYIQSVYNKTDLNKDEMIEDVSEGLRNADRDENIDGMITAIDDGYDSITSEMKTAVNQLNAISDDITGTFDKLTYDEKYIEDISSLDTADMQGVIIQCSNTGDVEGDINVGGITGCMNIEYDQDPEYDIDVTEETDVTLRTTVNCIVIHCSSNCHVRSKKDCVGGVVGQQEFGLIYDCEGYGSISSSSGDYMGGIAGYSAGMIQNSYSLCNLEGYDYMGGICGYGYTVKDCLSMCSIESDGECRGAIAGNLDDEGEHENNYFCSDSLQGIDSISYMGIAERVSYEELMNMDTAPEGFKAVCITYYTDEDIVCEQYVPYGTRITEDDYPSVSEKEGYYIMWPDNADGIVATGNMKLEAQFIPWEESLSGNVRSEDGRLLMIVNGRFRQDDSISMNSVSINAVMDEDSEILYAYNWNINSNESTGEMYSVRLFGGDNPENASVYVYDGSSLVKTDSEREDSYLLVNLNAGDTFAVIVKNNGYLIYYCAAFGAFVIILAVSSIIIIRKKRKKHKNGLP